MAARKYPAKAFKSGGSWAIVLPAQYVKDGSIDPHRELDVVVTNKGDGDNGELLQG